MTTHGKGTPSHSVGPSASIVSGVSVSSDLVGVPESTLSSTSKGKGRAVDDPTDESYSSKKQKTAYYNTPHSSQPPQPPPPHQQPPVALSQPPYQQPPVAPSQPPYQQPPVAPPHLAQPPHQQEFRTEDYSRPQHGSEQRGWPSSGYGMLRDDYYYGQQSMRGDYPFRPSRDEYFSGPSRAAYPPPPWGPYYPPPPPPPPSQSEVEYWRARAAHYEQLASKEQTPPHPNQ